MGSGLTQGITANWYAVNSCPTVICSNFLHRQMQHLLKGNGNKWTDRSRACNPDCKTEEKKKKKSLHLAVYKGYPIHKRGYWGSPTSSNEDSYASFEKLWPNLYG